MPGPPEVLADPLGVVVDLILETDPALERQAVEATVKTVAPGRATRRRLAQALIDRPSLLADGRSPAPRVVAELLVSLGGLGASNVSAPRCAACGKELRSFQRRGEDWYCGVCGPALTACAVCGKIRKVEARDRGGRPRCGRCPPDDGADPIAILIEVIARVDPGIGAEVVVGAVATVTSRAGQRRQLAWALQDRPELLTGSGAEAPVPSVLRLIDALRGAGSTIIVRPPCPHCGRLVTLSKTRDGKRICRGCEARLRAVPCSRCGAMRDPATRDEQGRPICPGCVVADPVNHEDCVGCGRRRPVSVRGPDGPRCARCRPLSEMRCAICGRVAVGEIAKATGKPWCRACQARWAECAGCGQVRAVRGGSAGRPLCATCTQPDPSFWRACPTCGETDKLAAGPCPRCVLRQRLRELLGDAEGVIRPELAALYENLATGRPPSVLRWMQRGRAAEVLAELGSGSLSLTHRSLDELPPAKPVEHLRAVLVATRALPARDEHMARLERWVLAAVTARADPDEQYLLRRYAIWHLLRRLRSRQHGADITYGQTTVVKSHVRVAVELLDWLAQRDLTLASCDQRHLDDWLASDGATRHGDAGHFVRWTAAEKVTRLELPAIRWTGPAGPMDADRRWAQARQLLFDDTIDTADRVAGLLVLLYAQRAAAIARLTVTHVHHDHDNVRLSLGDRPVVLPEPLGPLVLDLVATRRGHATLGELGTSPWLFPGGQPGRPISADRLNQRLHRHGIHAGPARSTALFQLATELPAAVIARMLGVHIKVAVQWQKAAGGDWTNYAADYSRRPTHQTP
jgi:hypothetical protein